MGPVPYPAIDYTDRDYASIRQALINAIPSRLPEWTSRSPQDFGIVLIELFATMGDILSYYADRVANESFLSTATQRQSVLKLANLLNYRPRGTTASTVTLQFTVDGSMSGVIPAGTQVRTRSADGSTPIVFSTDRDIQVASNNGISHDVTGAATQGYLVTQEQIGIAAGVQDESFVLLHAPVVESSLKVYLQEGEALPQLWSFVDNLIDARPSDDSFSTATDANGVVTVQFGDNINGRIPARSGVVLATYRVGGGQSGNVDANTIVELVNPIAGVQRVTNTAAAVGGSDVESTSSIRVNAPRSMQARGRAVTLEDYAALAVQVPLVAKARAEASVYSNVTIYVAPFGAQQPDQRLLNDVVSYMATRKLAGVDVVAATPTYVYVDIAVDIHVYDTYSRAQAASNVENTLRDVLAFDNVDFGDKITLGEIYALVSLSGGIMYSTITQMVRRGGTGAADIQLGPGEIPVIGTVTVNATGGTADGGAAWESSLGEGNGLPPGTPGQPTQIDSSIDGVDAETWRLSISWPPSDNATAYYVQVDYIAADTTTVLATHTVGPTADVDLFVFDLPKLDTAAYLRFTVTAQNGSAGSATGPASIDYAVPTP